VTTVSRPLIENSFGIVKRFRIIDEWLSELQQHRGSRLSILDYGCGTGEHLTYPLAAAGHHVLGVDVHTPSITEASVRYKLPNLKFRSAKLSELVSEQKRFDVVICSEVLEHLEEPGLLLTDFRRILVPDGALIVTVPNGYGSYEILSRLEQRLSRFRWYQRLKFRMPQNSEQSDPTAFLNKDSPHIQFFTFQHLDKLFIQAGYRLAERRARILVCGPYIDPLLAIWPFRQALYRLNNRLADLLPFDMAAAWLFRLEVKGD
jgi:SAM-dependent methyltransferase